MYAPLIEIRQKKLKYCILYMLTVAEKKSSATYEVCVCYQMQQQAVVWNKLKNKWIVSLSTRSEGMSLLRVFFTSEGEE